MLLLLCCCCCGAIAIYHSIGVQQLYKLNQFFNRLTVYYQKLAVLYPLRPLADRFLDPGGVWCEPKYFSLR